MAFPNLMTFTSSLTSTHVLASAIALVGVTALSIAYLDYRHYCSLGDHGLPGNYQGWRKQLEMSRMARKDTTVPAPYDFSTIKNDYGPHATESFLKTPLKTRQGSRPKIPSFVAPQRQISDQASQGMKKRMNAHLDSLVLARDDLLQRNLSRLEGAVPAVQIHPSLSTPAFLESTRGEIIHIHPPDGSTHLVLSLEDSKVVIENKWGQRHRLSGGGILPWNYTLVYAPRNEEEFGVWKGIVESAYLYCCAGLGDIQGIQR